MDAHSSGAAAYSTASGRHPGTTLTDAAVRLWPTPDAGAINDGEMPATFLDRRERYKAKGQDGNGMGTPLAMAAKLWPTPEASDGTGGRVSSGLGGTRESGAKRAISLGAAAAFRPTPTASDGNSRTTDPETSREGAPSLTGQALLWATPMARDGRGKGKPRDPGHGLDLSRQVLAIGRAGKPSSPFGPTSRQRLNPLFVEWLMGLPIGWTACEPLATGSFRSWLGLHSSLLRGGLG